MMRRDIGKTEAFKLPHYLLLEVVGLLFEVAVFKHSSRG